jgi:predicted dehydrogenase
MAKASAISLLDAAARVHLTLSIALRGGSRTESNPASAANVPMKKTYALVGTGGRATTFIEAIATRHADSSRLVALCDPSQVRMDHYNRCLTTQWNSQAVPTYKETDFEKMIAEQKPDAVIVTSMDRTHNDYIVRAMELGCDVVTEKPMTIDAARCQSILDAMERTGRSVRVCFNYRWQAAPTEIKRLISTGVIGNVKSVMLEYALDTNHGADYFRRWHSDKKNSGGLLVHKSTHHFDLVNWWIDSIPAEVFAWGDLVFYGKKNAVARGDEALTRYPRYTGTDCAGDPFALDITKDTLKALYLDAEAESGYIRDRNVFRDGITIEDTMAVLVKYRSGVVLTYSLNAFSSAEGYRVIFHGDRGRLEYAHFGGSHINRGQSDSALAAEQTSEFEELRVIPHFQSGHDVEIPFQPGAHGGGDLLLTAQIFSANPPVEKHGRDAGCEQGAASIIVGIAGNESMRTKQPVKIDDLITLRPDAVHLGDLKR